jgi:hypothetical protein
MVAYGPYDAKKVAPVDSTVQTYLSQLQSIPFKQDAYLQVIPNHEAGSASLSRYDLPQPEVDETAWAITEQLCEAYWIPHIVDAHSGNEAGNAGCVIYDADEDSVKTMLAQMEPSTSAGFPFSKTYRNKKECIAHETETIRQTAENWFDGQDIPFLWTVSVKSDEVRPKAKVEKNSLRTFIAPPIDLLCIMMLLCFDFNRRFYECALKTWSYVGGSLYHGMWNELFKKLSKFPYGFELDETAYDATVFRRLFHFIVRLRYACIKRSQRNPEMLDLLYRLYAIIVESLMVTTLGDVLQKLTGNPSGSFNTAVDNTLSLFFLLVYSWVVLARKHAPRLVFDIFKFVEAGLYGDDNTWTVSPEVIEWFNARNVSIVLNSVGVKARPAETLDPKPVMNLTFLSNGFLKHGMYIVPRPTPDRVFCSFYRHTRRPDFVLGAWMRACALRLNSFYTPELYKIIDGFCQWCMVNTQVCAELDAESKKAGVQWRSTYLRENELEAIYFKEEISTLNSQCRFLESLSVSYPHPWEEEWCHPFLREHLSLIQ